MSTRAEVTGAKRIVVKVGSSSLTTAAGGIDPARMRALVDVLAERRVTSSTVSRICPAITPWRASSSV